LSLTEHELRYNQAALELVFRFTSFAAVCLTSSRLKCWIFVISCLNSATYLLESTQDIQIFGLPAFEQDATEACGPKFL